MRLFITGATGFIGSHFVNSAMMRGHQVVALRRSHSRPPSFPLIQEPTWLTKEMTAVEPNDLIGFDCLVHLAAHTPNAPYDTLENCIYWNLVVPLALFRVALQADLRKFVVAGSSFEYGRSAMQFHRIPTNASLEPTQSYPASKAAATVAFSAFVAETASTMRVERIFQVYGPGESENRFWPSLRRAAMSGVDFPMSSGEQIRDFIHVESVAEKLVDSVESIREAPPSFEIGHIASGVEKSLREFAEHWWQHWEAKGKLLLGAVPMRQGEMMRFVPQVNATR